MFVGEGRVMQDVAALAPKLARDDDGVWQAPHTSAVDYPDEANAFCFASSTRGGAACRRWFARRCRTPVFCLGRFRQRACSTCSSTSPTIADCWGRFIPSSRPADSLHLGPCFRMAVVERGRLGRHHRRYTIRSLGDRLRDAGFMPEFATYLFAPLPLPILLLRSLPARLGFRRNLDAARASAELQPRENAATRVLRGFLARERAVIARGGRIALGSSCLVVARRATPGEVTRGRCAVPFVER